MPPFIIETVVNSLTEYVRRYKSKTVFHTRNTEAPKIEFVLGVGGTGAAAAVAAAEAADRSPDPESAAAVILRRSESGRILPLLKHDRKCALRPSLPIFCDDGS